MVQPINKHVRKLSCDLFFSAHTQTISSQSPRLSLSDKCQPPSSWTDIDGYLGLFLQSVVHLRTEMESISAWLAVRVTVGQSNLAGWHPLESLCLSCQAISGPISKVYLTQTSAHKNPSDLFSKTHKLVQGWRKQSANILLLICHFSLKVYINP